MTRYLSDRIVSVPKLIILGALAYAGAQSFAHAAEYRIEIECPHRPMLAATLYDNEEDTKAFGQRIFDKLDSATRADCELNVSKH